MITRMKIILMKLTRYKVQLEDHKVNLQAITIKEN